MCFPSYNEIMKLVNQYLRGISHISQMRRRGTFTYVQTAQVHGGPGTASVTTIQYILVYILENINIECELQRENLGVWFKHILFMYRLHRKGLGVA